MARKPLLSMYSHGPCNNVDDVADEDEVPDSLDDLIAWAALPRPRWMRDSLCREPAYASWNWFPDDRSASDAHLEQLRALCGKCLVRVECRRYGNEIEAACGIWGGATATELRAERRRKAA